MGPVLDSKLLISPKGDKLACLLIVPTKNNVFILPLRFSTKLFPGKPGAKTPASLFTDLNGYTFEPMW